MLRMTGIPNRLLVSRGKMPHNRPMSSGRLRRRCPSRTPLPFSIISDFANAIMSLIATLFGQTLVHTPHPLQSMGEISKPDLITRKRCACGPEYMGPGNSPVTAATGQWAWQIPHLVHWSIERSTVRRSRSVSRSSNTVPTCCSISTTPLSHKLV